MLYFYPPTDPNQAVVEIGMCSTPIITADGVSPRAWPGQSRHPILTDSHEHDETGHITEDARARRKMVEKRLRKNDHLRRALASPERVGPEDTTIVLVGWGSTWEVLREAVVLLRERGIDAGLVHFHDLWPFPTESAIDRMGSATRLIAVEGNATGQLAGLIRQHTGRTDVATVLKYDGRPFLVGELLRSLEGMVRS